MTARGNPVAWKRSEARRLYEWRAQRLPVAQIAQRLGRTEDSVWGFLQYHAKRADSAFRKPETVQ